MIRKFMAGWRKTNQILDLVRRIQANERLIKILKKRLKKLEQK